MLVRRVRSTVLTNMSQWFGQVETCDTVNMKKRTFYSLRILWMEFSVTGQKTYCVCVSWLLNNWVVSSTPLHCWTCFCISNPQLPQIGQDSKKSIHTNHFRRFIRFDYRFLIILAADCSPLIFTLNFETPTDKIHGSSHHWKVKHSGHSGRNISLFRI